MLPEEARSRMQQHAPGLKAIKEGARLRSQHQHEVEPARGMQHVQHVQDMQAGHIP